MELFNSLSSKLEEFKPLKQREVKIYVCGITPYDTTHLGHAFVYVIFDALKRFLEFSGYKVTYTQNVTDIDDDILKRAKRDGKNWQELGNFWTDKFINDLKSLNVKMPGNYIKATEAMPEIIEMVRILLEKGVAYQAGGNIYFEVSKFASYGKLSKFSGTQMARLLKERGGNPDDPNKKAPLDFLLWQKSAEGEPSWNSPAGRGRPGWHIECSAMINKTLGEQIDIHGGGFDLIYPHHESELAQSESFSGKKPFVKYWMHIAMVSYMGEKMSKSLGNLVLVSDLLKKYSPNAIRLMLLLNHYRKPWNYTKNLMENSQKIMEKVEHQLRRQPPRLQAKKFNHTPSGWEAKDIKLLQDLEYDFNTEFVLKKLIGLADRNPSQSKAGFELLGFSFI